MLRVDVVSARTSSDSELGMSENRQNVRPIKKTHKFLNLGALDSQVMRLPTARVGRPIS